MNMTIQSSQKWEAQVQASGGHLLQSWAWGELKAQFGWQPLRIKSAGGLAQLLFRRLPLGLTIAYLPKGPITDWTNPQQVEALLADIHAAARKHRAIFLKVEPDIERSDELPDTLTKPSALLKQPALFRPIRFNPPLHKSLI